MNESWCLAENRAGNGRTRSDAGWLLRAMLVLVLSGCGEAATNPRDAGKDAGPTPPPDSALPTYDVAPAREAGLTDVSSPDVPPSRDVAARPDAPLGFEAGGLDAPLVLPADAARESGVGSLDTGRDSGSSGSEAGTQAVDTGAETGLAFCAVQAGVDAGARQRLCYDFGDPASAADFVPEAGTWTVTNGAYAAAGPPQQVTCATGNGSLMTESVLAGVTARDVRVHAKMTAIKSPDKVLVLRSRPGGNRIELNFRANFVFEDIAQGGDLYISALIDCQHITYVTVDTIHIPHAIGQSIVADVELVGRHLVVAVDGKRVFDDTLPLPNDGGSVTFPTDPGKVGFAVFRDAVTEFDDFLVEVLD